MPRVAVLGEAAVVTGYSLAGAVVLPADTEADVLAAWQRLPDDVGVVILTARAAGILGEAATTALGPLAVVIPP